MNPNANATSRRRGRPLSHPENDLRTPEEIAWWNENVSALAHPRPPLPLSQPKQKKHAPPLPVPHAELADAWLYDGKHLLRELTRVREELLKIPPLPAKNADTVAQQDYYTLAHRSCINAAIDRIWHLEEDIRFFLRLHRDGQRSFARQAEAPASKTHKTKKQKGAATVVKILEIRG